MNCVIPCLAQIQMLWQTKKLIPGLLSKLFWQLLPALLQCLKKLSRKMSSNNYPQVWTCKEGILRLELPSKAAYFSMDHDKFLACVRGSLSISEFLRYVLKFINVYKNMI